MNRELLRAMTAEAIGTFALVFAGCGAIMVDAQTHQLGHLHALWLYILAPIVGALLGGLAYQFVRGEQTRPEPAS